MEKMNLSLLTIKEKIDNDPNRLDTRLEYDIDIFEDLAEFTMPEYKTIITKDGEELEVLGRATGGIRLDGMDLDIDIEFHYDSEREESWCTANNFDTLIYITKRLV
jgi:hypothetical protein